MMKETRLLQVTVSMIANVCFQNDDDGKKHICIISLIPLQSGNQISALNFFACFVEEYFLQGSPEI